MNSEFLRTTWTFALVLCGMFVASGSAMADEAFPDDIWREIPVYHHGRVKPMDGYARQVVQKITEYNKSKPKFNLTDYYTEEELQKPEFKDALEIFPNGELRKFSPSELVYEWTVRPEKWEHVPFIYLGREDVRKELGFPINGHNSMKLNFVSPHDIATSQKLREYLKGMETRRQEQASSGDLEETAMDAHIWRELLFRYAVFREVSLDPRNDVVSTSPLPSPGERDRFIGQVYAAGKTLFGDPNSGEERTLNSQLQTLQQFGGDHPLSVASKRLVDSYRDLHELSSAAYMDPMSVLNSPADQPLKPEFAPTPAEAEPLVQEFQAAAKALGDILEEQRDNVNDSTTLTDEEYNNIKPMFQSMLVRVRQLEHNALEIHLALYENANAAALTASTSMDRGGNHLQIVPSLNPYALSKSRDPSDLSQPWLGLTTVLYGSDDVLAGYDMGLINAVRSNWKATKDAYLSGGDARPAMEKLADSLQRLGDQDTQQRVAVIEKTIGSDERDSGILAYTAYPAANSYRIATEVRYNTMDPFMYAWIFTFIATIGFALAFAVMRKPMFWMGVGFLVFGLIWSTYGFYMRVVVTGWAPVTNMYETVIFVPWVVCSLGLMFLLLPIYDRGRLAAWRATAFPFIWEEAELTESQLEMFSSATVWRVFNFVSGVLRMPLMGLVAYYMLALPIYDGNRALINFERIVLSDSMLANLQMVVFGVILLGTLILSVWYLPRLFISAILLPFFCVYDWACIDKNIKERFQKAYTRNYYGLAAAVCGTFLLCVASIAPIVDTGSSRVLNSEFSPLQPVLRSNVWLTVHVLTIVASYGAGILAWGLGWLALGYYMFGKYRAPVVASPLNAGLAPAQGHSPQMSYRPPEECFTLGQHCYRAIQVAVLLLATGTILGGIWADASWGRFWGWDPKEVWALVTLLIYVAILHARFAGWFNNFGLVVGTIIGFSAIVGSWYGVNFLLPLFKGGDAVGLHSYGSGGKGSEIMVMGFVASNWIALGFVALRFQLSKLSVVDENEVEEVVIKDDLSTYQGASTEGGLADSN
ncbi:cytochrome c biogenesis protein [Bremerella sp.]|uniref:cytochrome c biogenesis protein n=1 Tax=Bremerella sp. TaxID=2795602 RepID=UPI003918FBA0